MNIEMFMRGQLVGRYPVEGITYAFDKIPCEDFEEYVDRKQLLVDRLVMDFILNTLPVAARKMNNVQFAVVFESRLNDMVIDLDEEINLRA